VKLFLDSIYALGVIAWASLAAFALIVGYQLFAPSLRKVYRRVFKNDDSKNDNSKKSGFGGQSLGGRAATVGVLCFALILAPILAGCSTAWVGTFDNILTAAAPALINILEIVALSKGVPIDAALESKINADAATMKSLANDFAVASASASPQVCSQLQAAIQTYSNDQQQVMSLANVANPVVQEKITVLSSLVAGTVTAVLAVVPQCQQASQMKASLVKAAPPIPLKEFVGSYDAILTKPTGVKDIDSFTKKHAIHYHGKLVRALTFGFAN